MVNCPLPDVIERRSDEYRRTSASGTSDFTIWPLPLASTPSTRPRRLFRSPMMSPTLSSGTTISSSMIGSGNTRPPPRAPAGGVDELEVGAGGEGFHPEPAVPVLAAPPGLLLVLPLGLRRPLDRLLVRNLGGAQLHLDPELAPKLLDGHLEGDLPPPPQNEP